MVLQFAEEKKKINSNNETDRQRETHTDSKRKKGTWRGIRNNMNIMKYQIQTLMLLTISSVCLLVPAD